MTKPVLTKVFRLIAELPLPADALASAEVIAKMRPPFDALREAVAAVDGGTVTTDIVHTRKKESNEASAHD